MSCALPGAGGGGNSFSIATGGLPARYPGGTCRGGVAIADPTGGKVADAALGACALAAVPGPTAPSPAAMKPIKTTRIARLPWQTVPHSAVVPGQSPWQVGPINFDLAQIDATRSTLGCLAP
jgi:hypothetical protein